MKIKQSLHTIKVASVAAALILALSPVLASAADATYSSHNYTSSANLFCLSYQKGTVQTLTHGRIQGKVENGVQEYLNVPYAAAPVGKLRFHSAMPPHTWQGVLDATKVGPDALQVKVNADGTLGARGSESALNFNLYRPDNDHTGLPILMFIHGGNNQTGSAQDILAQNLVKRGDVVVISLNYRLGLLGFNSLPALEKHLKAQGDEVAASGNITMSDFKAFFNFIKANAFAFGANPNNITVSGFSAGGRDVMALLISPMFKGDFQKAISFSGGMTTADPELSALVVAKALAPDFVKAGYAPNEAEAISELLNPDSKKTVEFLYSVKGDVLAHTFGDAGIRMARFPHLYSDGKVLPSDGFDTQNYNSVPLIMLTGSREFSAFASGDPMFKAGIKNKQYLSDEKFKASYEFAVDYGSALYANFNAQESAVRMFDNYHAPIYTTQINYGDNAEVVGDEMATLFGATHGIFLPFLCDGKIGLRAAYPQSFDNNGARELTDSFMSYMVNFLWTDNPNGVSLSTHQQLPKWSAWTAKDSGPTDLIFDADKESAHIVQTDARYNYDEILYTLEKDTRLDGFDPALKSDIIKHVLNGRWFSSGLDKHFNNPSLYPSHD